MVTLRLLKMVGKESFTGKCIEYSQTVNNADLPLET
jgi:hypothetical protein